MWHYVVPSAGAEGNSDVVSLFLTQALREAGIDRLAAREPRFHSAEQADEGLMDGDEVAADRAVRMLVTAAAGDRDLPDARFEAPGEQYAMAGLDYEVYLGLTVRPEQAVKRAQDHGLEMALASEPSPYLGQPGESTDPPLTAEVWETLAERVGREPLFALQRWAQGRYGELGHFLRNADDVRRMAASIRPRAGVAIFSAGLIHPLAEIHDILASTPDDLARRELNLIYERGGPWPVAVNFRDLRGLEQRLAEVPAGAELTVLAAPPFADWEPPIVTAFVQADPDGVVRSRLGYHLIEP